MTEHYRVGAVSLVELDGRERGSWFVVMDPDHYRVRFFPLRDSKTLGIGIDAEWSVEKPGELANFTPDYEFSGGNCHPGEVTISDEGLLSVMPRQRTAHIDIRMGWTAQLPLEAVEPIRRAIALAEAALLAADSIG